MRAYHTEGASIYRGVISVCHQHGLRAYRTEVVPVYHGVMTICHQRGLRKGQARYRQVHLRYTIKKWRLQRQKRLPWVKNGILAEQAAHALVCRDQPKVQGQASDQAQGNVSQGAEGVRQDQGVRHAAADQRSYSLIAANSSGRIRATDRYHRRCGGAVLSSAARERVGHDHVAHNAGHRTLFTGAKKVVHAEPRLSKAVRPTPLPYVHCAILSFGLISTISSHCPQPIA